jgi:hypothetical protein
MLHAGLDLSRRRLDVCLLAADGEPKAELAVSPDADGLRRLTEGLEGQRVRAVIESMTGARYVHDTLEELGWYWSPTPRRSRGWRRWRARPTASTPGCWPSCRGGIWCRRSGCPTRAFVASASWPAEASTWSATAPP